MSQLTRVSAGGYDIKQARHLDDIAQRMAEEGTFR